MFKRNKKDIHARPTLGNKGTYKSKAERVNDYLLDSWYGPYLLTFGAFGVGLVAGSLTGYYLPYLG